MCSRAVRKEGRKEALTDRRSTQKDSILSSCFVTVSEKCVLVQSDDFFYYQDFKMRDKLEIIVILAIRLIRLLPAKRGMQVFRNTC